MPLDITKTTWSHFLDGDEPMHALVAEGSSDLLGLAHSLFHCNITQIGPSCHLQDLYTCESARRRGRRALIDEVYQQALAAGSTRGYWQSRENNAAAMRLYDKVVEKSGFCVYRKML